jgi:tetratricopeptide (TPR) repeat protein
MKALIRKLPLLSLLCLAVLLQPVEAFAQASECGVKRRVKPGSLDEATWKRLNAVYEEVGEEQYDSAYEKLENMIPRMVDDYSKAVLAQAMAQVEWARGNYDESLKGFERAVGLDALPDLAHFGLMYQIAQLYYMKDRYDDALDKLALWMCKVPEEKITDAAYVLQASLYAQKKDWKNVIVAIETAISMSTEPKESWYQMKLAAHFELEQFPKAAQTLEILIQGWPEKKTYWMQLSQIYYKLMMADKALSVIALAYRKDMLDKETDIMYLSNLYSNSEVPYKAAQVLQKGIEDGIVESSKKNWTIVADAWYTAQELENALVGYEKAGRESTDGEIDLRRAFILVDLERWESAKEAVNAALEKGGLPEKKMGEAYVLQGMSEFNLGNYERASVAWGRATKYEQSRKSAEQWLNHMREERNRRS